VAKHAQPSQVCLGCDTNRYDSKGTFMQTKSR